MVRHLNFTLFALSFTLVMLGAIPAAAWAAATHYRAQPVDAPAQDRLIVRDLVWKCGAAGCVAGKSNSRPVVDCSALVRKVGELRSFTVAGRALAPEELEKCNSRAR